MPSKTAEVVALTTKRMDHKGRIDAVIAEFGGDVDAATALTRMAEEILYWRKRMELISEVVGKVQSEEPFAIIGAGPHWKPGERSRWWWWWWW